LGLDERKVESSKKKRTVITVRNGFPKMLLHDGVRAAVMLLFVGYFCFNGALVSDIEIGLDESLAMPRDSYMLDYFKDLKQYLSVGPPLYFVVKDGYDYTKYDSQNYVCGVSRCSDQSLAQQITEAALYPDKTYIAQSASSWIDDYFAWLQSDKCCRTYNTDNNFCASTKNCEDSLTTACNPSEQKEGRPVGDSFTQFLPWFLADNPNIKCGKGGHAAHGSAVELKTDPQLRVGATYFQTYHTVLKNSTDYIDAIKWARKITDNINDNIKGESEVYPYSVFYVFYEMYLDIVENAALNIFYCLLAVFITTYILLGLDAHSACLLTLTIVMIVCDVMGMMQLWDIRMNPISLVNLTMTVGMSVEFCSHIMHAYSCSTKRTRKNRAQIALQTMGGPVLYGIVVTNLIGTVVLAAAHSMLFRVYYFRMYMGTLVLGAGHGLLFLPVLLSYVGPPINKAKFATPNPSKGRLNADFEHDQGHENKCDEEVDDEGGSDYDYKSSCDVRPEEVQRFECTDDSLLPVGKETLQPLNVSSGKSFHLSVPAKATVGDESSVDSRTGETSAVKNDKRKQRPKDEDVVRRRSFLEEFSRTLSE